MLDKEEMILGPYKEPLNKFVEGFGYMGCISLSTTGRIQCHFCGKLFENLSFHVRSHNISVKEYKKKFEIATYTSLISEKERERLKISCFKMRENLGKDKMEEIMVKMSEGRKKYLNTHSKEEIYNHQRQKLEHKNLRGTCPDQLIYLIKDCYKSIGKTPTYEEFMGFYQTQRFFRPIKETFGSWSKAIEKSGLEKPNRKNCSFYSDEELLEYLSDFYKERKSIPSNTDFARGLLPSYSIYIKRFKTITNARKLAGIHLLK